MVKAGKGPAIRDRVVGLRRVKARDLIPSAANWRHHPTSQRKALEGVLAEVGFAGALLARETPEGLVLIDGHLRAETTPDMEVPVLVLDVTEEEAKKLLAVYDPLSAMAQADTDALLALLQDVKFESADVNALLEALANNERLPMPRFDQMTDMPSQREGR